MKTHTPEQMQALADFEAACTSRDLHSFGHGRKGRAHRDVVFCFERLSLLGIADALTDREQFQVKISTSFTT